MLKVDVGPPSESIYARGRVWLLINIEMWGEGGGRIARDAQPKRATCSGKGIDHVSRFLFLSMDSGSVYAVSRGEMCWRMYATYAVDNLTIISVAPAST